MSVDVRRCTVAELDDAPELPALLAEYAAESRLEELGDPQPQRATYYALESAGVLFPIAAFDADRLVGFILPIVAAPPHYGVLVATVESFFVPVDERKRGIGLQLLDAALELARDRGARALLVIAPAGGALAGVLPGRGFRHSNEVFVKALA